MFRVARPRPLFSETKTARRHPGRYWKGVANDPMVHAATTLAQALPQRLTFTVPGEAVPQGSAQPFTPKGWTRAIVRSDNPHTKPWRLLVAAAAIDAQFNQGTWPVLSVQAIRLDIDCYFVRPASVSERRRPFMTVRPDGDKCLRAIGDALAKLLYRDDAQIVAKSIQKHYAPATEPAHTVIRIYEILAPVPERAMTKTELGALAPLSKGCAL